MILSFALVCLGGNIQIQDKDRPDKIVRKAGGGGGGGGNRSKKTGQPGHIVPTTCDKQNVRNRKKIPRILCIKDMTADR